MTPAGAVPLMGGGASFGAWQYAESLAEVSTTVAQQWQQLAGPSITLTAPSDNSLIAVMFAAELKATAGNAQLRLIGLDASQWQILDRTNTAYARVVAFPGSSAGSPTVMGGALILPVSAGQHVIRPEHRAGSSGATASFQNQRMWAAVSAL